MTPLLTHYNMAQSDSETMCKLAAAACLVGGQPLKTYSRVIKYCLLNIPRNSSMTFPSIKCITCYKLPSSWGISQLATFHYQRVPLWFETNYIHRQKNEYEPTPRKFQSGVMMSSSFLRKFNCHISAWHHLKYCLSSHFWTSNPIFPGSRGPKHPWETPILLRIPIQKSWKIPMLLSFFMAETSSGNSPTLQSLKAKPSWYPLTYQHLGSCARIAPTKRHKTARHSLRWARKGYRECIPVDTVDTSVCI
jgi:hypothetical protein